MFENGLVTRFEKGRAEAAEIGMAYIDYGLSMLTKNVIETHFPAAGAFDLAQVYGRLAEAAQLRSFEAFERFYEIGSAQDLRDLETHLASGHEKEK